MMRKNLLSLLFSVFIGLQVFAQDKTVSGKVTSSEDGTPLPGVSITVKGTTKGASTDANGVYKISTPANSILVFSYVGFTMREIQINNQTIIDLQLSPDAGVLNEVVVVGYGQQSKKLSTQTIATVGSKAIANRPVLSPQELLQGQAAGVQMVGSSGLLGANPVIRIRGAASITGGGQPLFVVDGVPLNDGTLSAGQGAPVGLNP